MRFPTFLRLIRFAEVLPGALGLAVRSAVAQAADPSSAAAVLIHHVETAPVVPRDWLPCLHHDGFACAECKGGPALGYLQAPSDPASWSVRAQRARHWAARPGDVSAKRFLHAQAATAWGMVALLTTGRARTQAMDSAVRDWIAAGQMGEAQLIVLDYPDDAGPWALAQTGDVGESVYLRRAARAEMSQASLRPTAHELGDE